VRSEASCRLPIDKNTIGDSSDTSHDKRNKMSREPHAGQGRFNESPLQSVIGFGHISFDSHISILPVCMLEVVKNVKGNEGVICNKSKGFNSVGYSFSDELKNDITEGYRLIIFRRGRGFCF
jgi:hypothetical protein